MTFFKKCPTCRGTMVAKEVEKLLRGGSNIASLRVTAEVCLHCGERLYDENTIRKFEEIRHKLEYQQTSEFQAMGQSFRIN